MIIHPSNPYDPMLPRPIDEEIKKDIKKAAKPPGTGDTKVFQSEKDKDKSITDDETPPLPPSPLFQQGPTKRY